MRIAITGATGNVGTSVVASLAGEPLVDSVTGLARRRPAWRPEKVTWAEADILWADLEAIFRGADAVVHLAWAIQPSHDEDVLERINLAGTRRVLDAVAAARVPKLVYASSVGAYAPGPKDELIDESWPTGATASSFYSRHKVAVEAMLDRFEADQPGVAVVRLRPALIFKGEAASEIRRLFAGPFLPTPLLHPSLMFAMPDIPGLRFQGVHSLDVGDAYRRALIEEVRGPFNIAAEPVLGPPEIAELMTARTFPLPARAARAAADLSWRARLQPSGPGWLDMALNVPLMSSERARNELGWRPGHTATEALGELIEGLREGRGFPTPPLRPSSAIGRLKEVIGTRVGGRQMPGPAQSPLVPYLADAHAIEEQALIQMRKAPAIARDPELAAIFEEHEAETAEHRELIRERLGAHLAEPSRLKDAAGKAGGAGMLLFAESQPDSPGKLVAHAFSYEHMEAAAYMLLEQIALREGDAETAALARHILRQEQAMARRLANHFDTAVEASLAELSGDDIGRHLDHYLADAHAIEMQALTLLSAAPQLVDDDRLASTFRDHLAETKGHETQVAKRIGERGMAPSAVKDTGASLGGVGIGAFFGAQPDTNLKLAGFAYAFEHLEIGAYELLSRVAERAGDDETVRLAESVLGEERAAAKAIRKHLKEMRTVMAELTTLEEKLAEVTGLAQAAQAAIKEVGGMIDDEKIIGTLEKMKAEAEETEERCEALAGEHDGKKTAILEKARETKQEGAEMMSTYLGDDADGLDGLEFMIMAEAGEVGHWEILGKIGEVESDQQVTDLVGWALPIQERHLSDVRSCSLRLAEAEAG